MFFERLWFASVLPLERGKLGDKLSSVAGPLKLARKYQVDPVFQRIISLIQQDWPTTLEDWDKIQDTQSARTKRLRVSAALAVINLARSCDVPSIRTMAFYTLSSGYVTKEMYSTLSTDDLVILNRGKECIHNYLWTDAIDETDLERWFDHNCGLVRCHLAAWQHWKLMMQDSLDGDGLLSALRRRIEILRKPAADSHSDDESTEPLCTGKQEPCRLKYADCLAKVHQNLFGNLPSYFAEE